MHEYLGSNSSKPLLEYNVDQVPLEESRSIMTFLISLKVTGICSFKVVLEERAAKETSESLDFSENISANNLPQ